MADEVQVTEEVAKSRKGLFAALGGIVAVAAVGAGVTYVMGIGPFERSDNELVTPPPATAPTETEAEEPAEETPVTPVAAAATPELPPTDAQELMFFEQVASAEQISDLVGNKWADFEVSNVAVTGDVATMDVKGLYREGGILSGSIIMRKYNDAWYFSMITRDGNPESTAKSGTADMDVAKAMCELQSANQELPKALVEGGYNTITIDKVTQGSGTATLEVTLTGTAGEAKGKITAISKTFNGATHWFITGFSK